MPGPAHPSHSRAPSQTSHRLSTDVPAPYAQPCSWQPHNPRHACPARPSRAPYQHRRHVSSVADDFDSDFESADFDARLSLFSIAAAISPLSPRWSLVPPDRAKEVDDDGDGDNDDNDDNDATEGDNDHDHAGGTTTNQRPAHDQPSSRTSTQIPLSLLFNAQSPRNTVALAGAASAASPRLSMMSTTSTLSTPSTTSTTTALRRFWSPSSALSAPSSPPLSSSATMTPGGPATASTAPSTAPSTTAASTPSSTLAGAPIPCAIGSGSSSNSTAATRRNSGDVIMYIPPLVDATGGTLPRWQRRLLATAASAVPSAAAAPIEDHFAAASPHRLLTADLLCLAHSAPELLGLVWSRAVWPLLRLLLAPDRPGGGLWGGRGGGVAPPPVPLHLLALSFDEVVDAGETALQLGLALLGTCLLLAMPVLFLCLPGALFLACLGVGIAAARIASWPLNNSSSSSSSSAKVPVVPWSIDAGETGTPANKDVDESWFFVSGLGATTRSLAKTGPRLAAVFGRPIAIIRPSHTYGMAADMAYAVLQRLLLPFCELPAPGVDTLYTSIRCALMAQPNTQHNDRAQQRQNHRVVVLAHNTGAIVVSQALARLQAVVPAARLARLEIYTFGSLAPDFVLPTGRTQIDAGDVPHVEHVAHVRDPCARFGVLRSVREDLVGRYCGGVFVLGGEKRAAAGSLAMLRPVRCVSRRDHSPMFRDIGAAPARATQRKGVVINSKIGSGGSGGKNRRLSFPLSLNQQDEPYQQHKIQSGPANDTTSAKNTKRWSTGLVGSLAAANRRSSSGSVNSAGSTEQQQAASSVWSLSSALAAGRHYTNQRSTVSMEDYLTALFGPEPWSMRPDIDGGCLSLDAYFASATIAVDRELAEKREMAAMVQSTVGNHKQGSEGVSTGDEPARSKVAAAHLSWTGLGATAAYAARKASDNGATGADKRLAEDDGLLGLEVTRRFCCECDGQSGRDVSRLVGYFSEAVVWHRERFGF